MTKRTIERTIEPVQPGNFTGTTPEFERCGDVQRVYGIKRGTAYNLLRDGKIKGRPAACSRKEIWGAPVGHAKHRRLHPLSNGGGGRRMKPLRATSLLRGASVPTDKIGDRELSAWQVGPGTMWVQTRCPECARKLSRRANTRLVATGVAGGFLRAFEVAKPLAWARRLIRRYQTGLETVTNACLAGNWCF